MFLPFLTDAPEVWLMVSETLHSVSHHDANAKPGTTTQGNRPKTLRRGRKGAHVIQKTKIRSNDQSQNNGNFGEGIRIFLKGRARLFIFVPPKK